METVCSLVDVCLLPKRPTSTSSPMWEPQIFTFGVLIDKPPMQGISTVTLTEENDRSVKLTTPSAGLNSAVIRQSDNFTYPMSRHWVASKSIGSKSRRHIDRDNRSDDDLPRQQWKTEGRMSGSIVGDLLKTDVPSKSVIGTVRLSNRGTWLRMRGIWQKWRGGLCYGWRMERDRW